MNKYTIYCTKEQTKKAFDLGAPIEKVCHSLTEEWENKIPTAEQMIGWLRNKGFRFKIDELSDTITAYRVTFGYWYRNGQSSNPKGATIAVIDAALDYLSKL